eukprot:Sro1402_g269570.2  (191) ;mRNA; r:15312-15884
MNLRLAGQGAEGDPGAPQGNLLVNVLVEPDDYFQRDGFDVHTEVPISLTEAVLGGTVDVQTLTGMVEMKVPKGCQVDTKLMLRGKGIPYLNHNQHGNQIVHLQIEIPKEITQRQEELLREFDQEAVESGKGMGGRLSDAVGSAFSNLFGSKKKDNSQSKTKTKQDKEESKKVQDSDSDEEEEDAKKTAAQ